MTYVRRAIKRGTDGTHSDDFTWIIAKPDTTFIEPPGCVLCDYGDTLTETDKKQITDQSIIRAKNVHKLTKNENLTDNWLYLPGDSIPDDAVPLPSGMGGNST